MTEIRQLVQSIAVSASASVYCSDVANELKAHDTHDPPKLMEEVKGLHMSLIL